MKYYVAESYKNMERIGEPFEKDGRMYTKVRGACDRCGGKGIYGWGAIVNGSPQYAGTCFKCNGNGYEEKVVRLYTEKEFTAAQRAKMNRRAAAAKRKEERKAKAYNRWLEWNGFSEDGYTYIYFGNTFPIKDELKARGCKYNGDLKWHGPELLPIPEDCHVARVHFNEVYDWDAEGCRALLTDAGALHLKDIFDVVCRGEYMGEVKERLRNLKAILVEQRKNKRYGGWIYTFTVGYYDLIWFTEKDLSYLGENVPVILTGTVKKHDIYGGVRMTYLNRCIVKRAEGKDDE